VGDGVSARLDTDERWQGN